MAICEAKGLWTPAPIHPNDLVLIEHDPLLWPSSTQALPGKFIGMRLVEEKNGWIGTCPAALREKNGWIG